jgi:hypothetical protein
MTIVTWTLTPAVGGGWPRIVAGLARVSAGPVQ